MTDFETLLAKDTISGQEGRATQNIDGEITDMFLPKLLRQLLKRIKLK